MSKLSEADKQELLRGLDSSGNSLWSIFDELADRLLKQVHLEAEDYLTRILRPLDDAACDVDRSAEAVSIRQRLDGALTSLTLLEIGFELNVLDPLKLDLVPLVGFSTLIDRSEAFLRYVNAYLYFGARMFAGRFFPLDWKHEPLPCNRLDVLPNRLWFPVATPPSPALPHANLETQAQNAAWLRDNEAWEEAFAGLLQLQQQQQQNSFSAGLGFLDGFHDRSAQVSHDAGNTPVEAEAAQYELWLRGLMPPSRAEMEWKPAEDAKSAQPANAQTSGAAQPWMTAEGRERFKKEAPEQEKARETARSKVSLQDNRFELITDQLLAWIEGRVNFYRDLQQQLEDQHQDPCQEPDDEHITNPAAARFALADIYWIARLLRAEVSANASVIYPRVSWLHVLRFRAALDGSTVRERKLKRAEDTLRSVFDFVCDLVQNAVEISAREERRACNPEAYPKDPPPWPSEWREVFDDELSEIVLQRKLRQSTKSDPFALPNRTPYTASRHSGWSERIITGLEPHSRIGLAFSGGGIRSATFNLGVLQGLQDFDLLRQVDYLSTVSGGGFIGAWLAGNVQRNRHWLGKGTCWDASVDHLRQYASYLAPITGILSADTWTMAATWIRNTFLVQLSALVWVFFVLTATLVARKTFVGLSEFPRDLRVGIPFLHPQRWCIPYAGSLAFFMAFIVTWNLAYNFEEQRVKTGRRSPGKWIKLGLAKAPAWVATCIKAILRSPQVGVVRWLAVIPSWVGSFFIASKLWSEALYGPWVSPALPGLQDYSSLLARTWDRLPYILFLYWVALLIIGWRALKPGNTVDNTAGESGARAEIDAKLLGWRVWRMLWIGTICLIVLYLALCAILYIFIRWAADPLHYGSIAFVLGPAFLLAAFTLSIVVFIGLSGRKSIEAQREWWTRFGAWLTIYAIVGLLLSSFVVFGPKLFILLCQSAGGWGRAIKWGSVLSGLGTVIGGLFAGNSSKTSGENSANKSLPLELLAKVGGLIFVIGAVITSASILYLFLLNFTELPAMETASYWDGLSLLYWASLDVLGWRPLLIVLVALLLLGLLFSYFFEINIFGLSQFYRNRLVRCYLGATRWTPGIRKPHPFTKFNFNDDMPLSDLRNDGASGKRYRGPFPIINCTLNLAGSSDLILHTRHSASFSLTPLRCGADRPMVGYAPTGSSQNAKNSFAGGVKLGQAVAISGAAASPNMGYNTSPLVALLLTMFNVRLGWWFPNPGRDQWNARGLNSSLYYLTRELLGTADETQRFLNVSDGGHFENLGVYELIRRRCKVIIACDAECDEVLQFGALGNLVRICATDFGATIDIDVKSIRQQKEGFSLAHCAVGLIKYSNGSIGHLIYFKASVTGDEDIGTAQYRSAHPSFPHETTANQFFSEDQFESYRKLGRHVVVHSLRGTQPGYSTVKIAEKLADVTTPARSGGDAFLKHTKRLEQMWEQFRRSPALHSFIDELMNINPPIAVVPLQPPNPNGQGEELCMALELTQLMEDVFIDLQLDDFWEHPDNRGWAILFMRWARSPRFQMIWSQTRRTFGIRFEYFCQSRLGLTCDKPIVRV